MIDNLKTGMKFCRVRVFSIGVNLNVYLLGFRCKQSMLIYNTIYKNYFNKFNNSLYRYW